MDSDDTYIFNVLETMYNKIIEDNIKFLEGVPAQDLEFYTYCLLSGKNIIIWMIIPHIISRKQGIEKRIKLL